MLDHVSYSVCDFDKSVKFYDETLRILGIERLITLELELYKVAGYGVKSLSRPIFWIGREETPNVHENIGKARGFHLAFRAPDIKAVDTWHQKCLELGGKDNGKPGPRREYHEGYYGAFIIDPDGWRIEAAIHEYKKEA
jgi:catechol 2,3-dioxygenase-like lactoylglutathione lyase family enzyme